ncbi:MULTISPECIES: DNA internalization-related competence protein ComEC/Rec2 [unclassified Achromobacter]|uniref:DNA internalization-related competence protein ComEC/Rec2 n=1 Tax=unclassified Achromobacter TaxID=2626865 RepID=UPI001E30415E|nr:MULTISPECIES: DNA internalization-related competence protein ComEC/Rec2 [unclassified Achromobacter]
MRVRAALLTWVFAIAGVQTFAALPGGMTRCALAVTALGLVACGHVGCRWRPGALPFAYCLAAACAGIAYASERAAWRIAHALPPIHDNEVARVTLRITGLPVQQDGHARFDAEVLAAVPGPLPAKIQVDWWAQGYGAVLPTLAPGQVWQTALLLRRPHAALNPYAADASARLFHAGVRALGTVRGKPRRLMEAAATALPFWSVVRVHQARHALRQRLAQTLGALPYGGVVIALALGDQTAIDREDWTVFNATGVTHLVSISGLHVSLVAGLAGLGGAWCWRRLRWRGLGAAEWVPAQIAGGVAALAVAAVYCAMAGWGLPAQRTFFMLAVAVVAWLLRLPLSPGRVLVLAAAVVTLIDPWAPLAAGFWLSFGAVAVLMACSAGVLRRPAARAVPLPGGILHGALRRYGARFLAGSRLQLTINIALAPVLAVLTQQLSLAAPLANAFAIPAISLLATPLALLAAAMHAMPGLGAARDVAYWVAWAAHAVIEWTMAPLAWLAAQDWAVQPLAAPPSGLVLLACAGTAWALMAPGWPARRWGWLLLLPALAWRPDRPAPGAWSMTVLDVGQGGAAVLRTARHTLLFDTGPSSRSGSDAGARVVWPYLRAEGMTHIDTLVVSHGDLDHAGGIRGVLQGVAAGTSYASFNLPARVRTAEADADRAVARLGTFQRCQSGQAWTVDGVRFDFLHPAASRPAGGNGAQGAGRAGRSNDNGCVLRVRGRYHSVLLPGDIGVNQEDALASRLGRVDVVLAPHHGSATSSGDALVQAADATHLIVQAGYRNRFGHPAGRVLRRWQRAGAEIWRTDLDGAVLVDSNAAGLRLRALGEERARYWHGQ